MLASPMSLILRLGHIPGRRNHHLHRPCLRFHQFRQQGIHQYLYVSLLILPTTRPLQLILNELRSRLLTAVSLITLPFTWQPIARTAISKYSPTSPKQSIEPTTTNSTTTNSSTTNGASFLSQFEPLFKPISELPPPELSTRPRNLPSQNIQQK